MKEMKKMFGIFAMAGIIICATFTIGCSDDSEDYYASGDSEYTLAEETMLRGEPVRRRYELETSVTCYLTGSWNPIEYELVEVKAMVFVEENDGGGYTRWGIITYVDRENFVREAEITWLSSNLVLITISYDDYLGRTWAGNRQVMVPNNLIQ